MLFNSFEFLIFLPCVFALYWLMQGGLRAQNLLVLAASYLFYGWWDYRFLGLVFFSSVVDYSVGRLLDRNSPRRVRRVLLATSIATNLGVLGFFKYFDFFAQSLVTALHGLGVEASYPTLHIILPVGISFYTFQTMSYTIDVYRREIDAARDPIAFLAYVSFFPQLVAGPIERASQLLPQFQTPRVFSNSLASEGMRQILWGLFKKVVIADTCGIFANHAFENYDSLGSLWLLLGLFFFAWQIYGDFSGYSEIAIGTAKLFGFRLMVNFRTPYFSRDIAEFWRRWHISLSTWFRDYVYIPLGGSRGSRWVQFRNILAIFVLSGLWHGANWTFVVWGLLNTLFFLPLFFTSANRRHLDVAAQGRWLPSVRELRQMLTTSAMVLVAWAFFRADSVTHAWDYLLRMVTLAGGVGGLKPLPDFPGASARFLCAFVFIGLAVGLEWLHRERDTAVELSWPRWLRWSLYCGLLNAILLCGNFRQTDFIYFQF